VVNSELLLVIANVRLSAHSDSRSFGTAIDLVPLSLDPATAGSRQGAYSNAGIKLPTAICADLRLSSSVSMRAV
jgi:hypothetical protein